MERTQNLSRTDSKSKRDQGKTMPVVLGLIFLLFIAILVVVGVISKRANPVMLDEQGRPLSPAGQVSGRG